MHIQGAAKITLLLNIFCNLLSNDLKFRIDIIACAFICHHNVHATVLLKCHKLTAFLMLLALISCHHN